MIRYSTGNIFEANTEAIINTVNLVGVMGKGLALQFKQLFPHNFHIYQAACKAQAIGIGRLLLVNDQYNGQNIKIINFPTKVHWRNVSEYEYIEKGLDDLIAIIRREGIRSIAIPPLGAGNGGLDWTEVKRIICSKLNGTNCDIVVFEPGYKAESIMRNTKLTAARALLVYMLNKLLHEGENPTVFASVKLIYFLQRFGAKEIFKMDFERNIYGPYCDKARHLLHNIDGAYIYGFSDMSKKPFEPFAINKEKIQEVNDLVEHDIQLASIANTTSRFLDGNWDDFSLELMSSVDFLINETPTDSIESIHHKLCVWTPRKGKLFADETLTRQAYQHIKDFAL